MNMHESSEMTQTRILFSDLTIQQADGDIQIAVKVRMIVKQTTENQHNQTKPKEIILSTLNLILVPPSLRNK